MPNAVVTSRGRGDLQVVQEARTLTDPVLRAAVGEPPSAMQRVAAYHFGWSDADGQPADGSAGKAMRPAFVLAAAEAIGGLGRSAVPAVAVELVHNFMLLHDDVIDRDLTRRHRPTAWCVFGIQDAILAGDALLALAAKILSDDPDRAAAQAASRLQSCVIELRESEHLDCVFERRADVSLQECMAMAMAMAKTGALLGCACALGALYGGASAESLAAVDSFGLELWVAFQLADDLLDIWADPAIRESRPTPT